MSRQDKERRNRAGRSVIRVGGYEAFIPEPLPPADLDLNDQILTLLSKAERELGRLDAATAIVPNPDLFIFMYVRREAVLSSQIEGTHASLMDILEYEALREEAEEGVDVREIANYISAMHLGLDRLRELPISRRLLCEVHAELMKDVRGGEPQKTPGEFRTSQNWIGGGSPATARFVPPPPEEVGPAFADLERYLHDPGPVAPLVKVGLVHAQFETIHPFLDGNGRTGRLLITFWLVEQAILHGPLLYPSLYFKDHRDEYIDRLQAIRDGGEWEPWLAFFIEGIGVAARDAADRAIEIDQMREQDRALISERLGKRAPNALLLLDELFRLPVVNGKRVEELVGVSQPTASALVRDFMRIGILREVTGRRRDRLFVYDRYMALFPSAEDRG